MDLNRIPSTTHGHDFHSGHSRVVMVRKTDQRTFQVPQDGEEKPKFEKVTHETVQTYNGRRIQKTTRRIMEERLAVTRPPTETQPAPAAGGRPTSAHGSRTGSEPTPGPSSRPGSESTPGPSSRPGSESTPGPSTQSGSEPTPGPSTRPDSAPMGSRPGSSLEPGKPDDSMSSLNTEGEGAKDSSIPKGQTEDSKSLRTGSSSGGISGLGIEKSPREPAKDSFDQKKKGSSPSRKDENVNAYTRFAEACLSAHNHYRAKHDVPPLKLSKKLCQFSDSWAKRLASTGQMQHRPNSEYGENLFCVWSSDPNHKVTGHEPVDNWYAEIKDFYFGQEPRDLRAGHFTQVVWRSCKFLGVGYARSKNGQTFVVCNYDPPGNFIGNFAAQVPPVGGDIKKKEPFKPPAAPKGARPKKILLPKGSLKDALSKESDLSEDRPPLDQPKHIRESDMVLQNESVNLHNELRAKHGLHPVRNTQELSRLASEWAMMLIRDNKFGHRPNNKYGENIFCHWTNDPVTADAIGAKDAILAWYSEIKDYRFGEEPKNLKSGHFTQIIWRATQRIGIGRARDGKGRVVIVANYDPRGNYLGQFVNNCPAPLKK